jgi:phage internal scaffolding protein
MEVIKTLRENGTYRSSIVFDPKKYPEDVSLTKQQYKDDCDINVIMKRAKKGIMPNLTTLKPRFDDVSHIGDYSTIMNTLVKADQEFAKLPAHLRNKFDNDPAKLQKFMYDENNYDEAVKLGICNPKAQEPEPDPVPVV